jgi:hypothetical protein
VYIIYPRNQVYFGSNVKINFILIYFHRSPLNISSTFFFTKFTFCQELFMTYFRAKMSQLILFSLSISGIRLIPGTGYLQYISKINKSFILTFQNIILKIITKLKWELSKNLHWCVFKKTCERNLHNQQFVYLARAWFNTCKLSFIGTFESN